MRKLLLAIFLLLGLDLALLYLAGQAFGFWPVVAFVVLSAVAGTRLARREGTRVLGRIQAAQVAGKVPEDGLLSAGLITASGFLLAFPGPLSTLAGLLLLLAPVRALASRAAHRWLARKVQAGGVVITRLDQQPDDGHLGDDIIDVEATEVPPRTLPPR